MLAMNFKRLCFFTLLAGASLLAVLAITVCWVDPYQQFRKSDVYIGDARLEIAGVAKHHDYNALLMGSSMAMNHFPEQVDSLFADEHEPWVTRNFAIMGGSYDDYEVVIPWVLKEGKVKHFIFDLDFFSFAKPRHVIAQYLYSDNLFDKVEYFFNYTTLTKCVQKWLHPSKLEHLYHFKDKTGHQHLIEDYLRSKDENFIKTGHRFEYEVMCANFENSLLRFVKESPEVEWRFYFPPYNILEYVRYRDQGVWEDIMRFKQYMMETLLSQPHVKLYDFQPEMEWTFNMEDFYDIRHHSQELNREVMRCIKQEKYRVTADNYLEKLSSLKEMVNEVNVEELVPLTLTR